MPCRTSWTSRAYALGPPDSPKGRRMKWKEPHGVANAVFSRSDFSSSMTWKAPAPSIPLKTFELLRRTRLSSMWPMG